MKRSIGNQNGSFVCLLMVAALAAPSIQATQMEDDGSGNNKNAMMLQMMQMMQMMKEMQTQMQKLQNDNKNLKDELNKQKSQKEKEEQAKQSKQLEEKKNQEFLAKFSSIFYRSYSSMFKDHLYTISYAEHRFAIDNLSYNSEAAVGYISPKPADGLVPLYRIYIGKDSGQANDHYYTTSHEKYVDLITRYTTNRGDGIAGYISKTPKNGLAPLYELYRYDGGKKSDHFYTTSATERDTSTSAGYVYCQIAGYIRPPL